MCAPAGEDALQRHGQLAPEFPDAFGGETPDLTDAYAVRELPELVSVSPHPEQPWKTSKRSSTA